MSYHSAIHLGDQRYRKSFGGTKRLDDEMLRVVADLQGLERRDSHLGYRANIVIRLAPDNDLFLHGLNSLPSSGGAVAALNEQHSAPSLAPMRVSPSGLCPVGRVEKPAGSVSVLRRHSIIGPAGREWAARATARALVTSGRIERAAKGLGLCFVPGTATALHPNCPGVRRVRSSCRGYLLGDAAHRGPDLYEGTA
jgi:hypothetical protein